MQTSAAHRSVLVSLMPFCFLVTVSAGGCSLPLAASPCNGMGTHPACNVGLKPGESQVERGRPAPVIDAVGWVVGLPAKFWMLDHRMANHHISLKTEAALEEYLEANDLDEVKVRLNEYDPAGEWDRLVRNESICWPVRYSIGTLSVVGYTVLPGRLFGWDDYNPFTNTIHLYSDVVPVGLYLGGHAKDFAHREQKGWYALAYVTPILNIYPETRAANDAKDYLRAYGSSDSLKDGYRAICPFYMARCTSVASAATGLPLELAAVAAGHAVGQIEAAGAPDGMPAVPSPAHSQLDGAAAGGIRTSPSRPDYSR